MPASLEARDRLLLVIGPDAASAALIRRGRRVADYLRAECLAVYVSEAPDLTDLGEEQRDGLQRQLNFARGLQIETEILEGRGAAAGTIVSFARLHGVTQIFVTRQEGTGRRSWLTKPLAQQIVDLARDMQVTIVADRSQRRGID
jgi:two-component system sensor histidine kinase KdpD